jgi:DNA-binding HxlR family transcriptional regulator
MKTYGQYCPVAKAAEILGDRWTLLIVRDLLFGPVGFNELARGMPGISRSVLSNRLRHLERLGLIELADAGTGYQLTGPGRHLTDVIKVLGNWAARWILEDPTQAELDPDLLILWISRHVALEALPPRKTVIAFRLYGPKTGRLWLVLEQTGVSICHTDPGLDPANYVHLDGQLAALYRVYMGRCDLHEEIAAGQLTLAGTPALIRAFPTWFTWSNFSATVRAASAVVVSR